MLMCTTRTVYPWDIVLTREGDKLYMDKREGGPFGSFWPFLSLTPQLPILDMHRLPLRQ